MSAKTSGALTERMAASFKQLSAAANFLNTVSDSLGKNIGSIDSRLKKLKIGMTAWVEFANEDSSYEQGKMKWEIGYSKLPKFETWGLSIRALSFGANEEEPEEDVKAFNDCPRDLRLRSISKLPELIDLLSKEVSAKASEIKPMVDQAEEFAKALQLALDKNGDSEEEAE